MGLAKFAISDGTTEISLLDLNGIHLDEDGWTQKVAQAKDGGVFQDSPLAAGRRLVQRVFQNVIENIPLTIKGLTEDQLIAETGDMLRLLEKAAAYWVTDWQSVPVYLIRQADCETNPSYALIHSYACPELDDPYNQPFVQVGGNGAIFDDVALEIERGHWLANPPGQSECVQISGLQTWEYLAYWRVVTTDPVDFVFSLFQTVTGKILAGEDRQIWRSINDGVTWASATVFPSDHVYSFLQTTTNKILAGEVGQIDVSVDDGVTWGMATADPNAEVHAMIQTPTGKIIATDVGQIWQSTDDGVTWALATTLPSGTVWSLLQTTTGKILAGEIGQIWQSTDDGVTWALATTLPSGAVTSLLQSTTGKILAGEFGQIWQSTDDGSTWTLATTTPANFVYSLLQLTNGKILAGEFDQILETEDDGITWAVATTAPINIVYSLLQSTTGKIFAGDEGQIWANIETTTALGTSETCDDIVYIANRQNIANLTHIWIDDGGVFGANLFPMAAFPVSLLPAAPALNDAIYFGSAGVIDNSGPFGGLVFDLSSIILYTQNYTIAWEYWSGAAWVALTVQDGTNPSNRAFRILGVSSVHWVQPTNWAAVAVNGVTAYWVRARISVLAGVMTAPAQQDRSIYAPVLPYVDIASDQVLGDIPALAQIKAHNRSDKDGPAGSGPDLYDNRLLAGLRSYNRGVNFQAYLNISDEQNPFGVTATLGTNTTFGTDVSGPTGRSATYNPGGVEAMATRATISLGPSIARDFYGTFHAFLRGQRTAGASTDLTVRLQIVTGSGGVSFTTETRQLQTTTSFELLDFGQITIPAGGNSLLPTELGDTTELRVQASAASGTPNLVLYDLILIPTDEYSIDAVDVANENDSDVGRSGSVAKLLDLDSLTNPKIPVRAIVRQVGAGLITSIYNPITPGEVVLQSNTHQRLWFLAAKTSATGTGYYWISPPEISHSVQVFKNARYLGMRGAR